MGQPVRRVMLLLALMLCSVAVAAGAPKAYQPDPVKPFDLIVSLEWEPGSGDSLPQDLELAGCDPSAADQQFLDDLAFGIKETAAYLYYYSEGQMALRDVHIYTDGEQWDSADIRILASSSYRPTAYVGGIEIAPRVYANPSSGAPSVIFAPAAIYLGRLWDGGGARCGAWSAPAGWRTIGHEWAHHALYLYDEYFNVTTGARQYCTTTGLDSSVILDEPATLHDSLMAYHYSADKLWLQGSSPPHSSPPWSCEDTAQDHVHAMTDWKTIEHFYGTDGVAAPEALTDTIAFDGSPAAAMLNIQINRSGTAPAAASAPVKVSDTAAGARVGQAYLIRPSPVGPERIIGQGTIVTEGFPLPFWGVDTAAGDRAAIQVQNYRSGVRYTYPDAPETATALITDSNTYDLTAPQWQPALSITPRVMDSGGVSELIGLDVTLTGSGCPGSTPKQIEISYCPAGGQCWDAITDHQDSDGAFRHTFDFLRAGIEEQSALYGYIYAASSDNSAKGEVVAWYQLAGGVGPAHSDGHAPLVDGRVQVDVAPGSAGSTGENRVLINSAQFCSTSPLPAGVVDLLDTPFDVQPVRATPNGSIRWNGGQGDPALRVRLTYDEYILQQLGVDESQVVLLRYDPLQMSWQVLQHIDRDPQLNIISAPALSYGGSGMIYALAYVENTYALLPMIAK